MHPSVRSRLLQLLGLLVAAAVAPARAQEPADVRNEVFAGSDLEDYLRVLQLSGEGRELPWSLRGFSAGQVEAAFGAANWHPWSRRYRFGPDSVAGAMLGWVRPRVRTVVNTGFPDGVNDGALWAGRGVTGAIEGGGWFRVGPVSLVLAPMAFYAQNADFGLAAVDATYSPYADPRFPYAIDRPQRFGDGGYARIDPGQSTLRLELPGVVAGLSTANQVWGPGANYPILLGNNAAGFPHLFLGTSTPLNVGIGRVHGYGVWGRLDQSDYSPVTSGERRRFMSGLAGIFLPRGVAGLEIGAARFFHTPWPEEGLELSDFLRPLEGLLKRSVADDPESAQANQLASVFGRWAFPGAGFEVYGEFAREDHNYDLRDLLLEPDHNSAYMLGFRRAWTRNPDAWTVVRAELVNAEPSHLFRVREQVPFYIHQLTFQGHTHRGQILGSPAAYGGAGTSLAVDRYLSWGGWTAAWDRTVNARAGNYWATGITERQAVDTSHALRLGARWFRGELELSGSAALVYQFNRYFVDDAVNMNAALGMSWQP